MRVQFHHSSIAESRQKSYVGLHTIFSVAIASAALNGGTDAAVPYIQTRCAVFPRRALQLVVSASGLAHQYVNPGHCAEGLISEEDIWPLPVVVLAVSLLWSVLLLTQHRSSTDGE
jgi:hypothetical protein